jgi:hypothetical protein
MVERETRMEIRFERLHEKAMQRMDRLEANQERLEASQKKTDSQIQATANLVRSGIRLVAQLVQQQKESKTELREIARRQDAFLRSFRNGNGHKKN